MWVLKLGGSLARAPELRSWLDALANSSGPIRVVVPGGGPFADQAREAQREFGFGEPVAHRMALLAMAQYGWLLHGLSPRLIPATGLDGVRNAIAHGRLALWLPRDDEACNEALPQSWDVTSDTLALWLARELGATGVVLVKSAPPPGAAPHRADELAACGYLDAAFPALLAASGLRACWYAREEAVIIGDFRGNPAVAREIVP
jgi:aspartokinase-like uncharacterized kinase